MEPVDWNLVLSYNEIEVGVFERKVKQVFLHGKVYLAIAETSHAETAWQNLDQILKDHGEIYLMDRPKSYTVRVIMLASSRLHSHLKPTNRKP